PISRRLKDMTVGKFDVVCPYCELPGTPVPTTEDAPLCPTSVYGQTKLAQEQLVLICGNSLDIPSIALRYQNVYGPGQSLRNAYTGILSIFSGLILAGKAVRIFEDGMESRDFVFVEDAARATVDALEAGTSVTGPFNVGSGEQTS